jgi:hypothetical protein
MFELEQLILTSPISALASLQYQYLLVWNGPLDALTPGSLCSYSSFSSMMDSFSKFFLLFLLVFSFLSPVAKALSWRPFLGGSSLLRGETCLTR